MAYFWTGMEPKIFVSFFYVKNSKMYVEFFWFTVKKKKFLNVCRNSFVLQGQRKNSKICVEFFCFTGAISLLQDIFRMGAN